MTKEIPDVIIRKIDEVNLAIDTNDGFLKTLSDYYSFYAPNYLWHPKFKAKFWDGKISLLDRKFHTLPSGLLKNLVSFLEENEKTFEITNNRENLFDRTSLEEDFDRFVKSINLNPEKFTVRDYQREACIQSILDKRNLIISPTGSGKSFIIYLIFRYLQSRRLSKKMLLIVPTTNLVEQMFSDFKEYSELDDKWNPNELCHVIYSGKEKITNFPIIISTWQSLITIKDKEYFKNFDCVFVDEAHEAEAKSISGIMNNCKKAEYRYGCTGTLKDSKANPLQLIGAFGEIIYTKSLKELQDTEVLSNTPIMSILLKYSEDVKAKFHSKNGKLYKPTFDEELKFIYEYPKRNHLIKKILDNLKNQNTLILVHKLDHAIQLKKMLEENGYDDVNFLYSKTSSEEFEEVRARAEKKTNVIFIATFKKFQLGVNIKNLHNAIIASPAKGRIRTLQSFGRLLRNSTDGQTGHLFDLIDDLRYKGRINYCYQHGLIRLEYYSEEKQKIKYKAVDL